MRSLLVVASAFALSTVLTALMLALFKRYGGVSATENDRSMHKGVVPKGAGAPLLAAALMTAAAFGPWLEVQSLLMPVTIALAIVCWVDDAGQLPRRLRLIIHLTASTVCVLAVSGGLKILGVLPVALELVIAAVALAWFMNLYNFMDGIDGLAGLETVSIALGYAAIIWLTGENQTLLPLALALVGASVGFLMFNWPPARIFLGDVGSIPLGLLTGGLMLDLAVKGHWAAAMILPAYFVADATLTLIRRTMNREKVWRAHRTHSYQRAARALGSHAAVTLRVAACNTILVGGAAISIDRPIAGLAIAVAAVAVLLIYFEQTANRAGQRFGSP